MLSVRAVPVSSVAAHPSVPAVSRWIRQNLLATGIIIQVINSALLLACQAVHLYLLGVQALTFTISYRVEISLLIVECYCVTGRKVENDDIVQFHFSESGNSFIFPLRPFDV